MASFKEVIIAIILYSILGISISLCSSNSYVPTYAEHKELNENENDLQQAASNLDLDVSASESIAVTSNSHKIIATGWPSTSPMWPSVDLANGENEQKNSWPSMVEPFIYADKPRTVDYSLMLALNKSDSEMLMNHQKPIAVILSFEYYFNHGPKVTALPAIKIEIDRQQFKYLEPSSSTIKPRVWNKFNEQILVSESKQFENHDWLKFSLVNRQSPSLVAIRKLKVEFILTNSTSTTTPSSPESTSAVPEQQSPPEVNLQQTVPPTNAQPAEVTPEQPTTNDIQPPQPQVPQIPQAAEAPPPPPTPQRTTANLPPTTPKRPTRPVQPSRPPAGSFTPRAQNRPAKPFVPNVQPAEPDPNELVEEEPSVEEEFVDQNGQPLVEDQVPAGSDALTSSIKPVKPPAGKTNGWNPFGRRRRKREAGNEQTTITLTCYQSDSCPWKADSGEEPIQWSLARMPPSTNSVQNGYFYVSNRINYGNSANLLKLSLNQTDSATIADQNSDHCIELALYITERTHISLYRLLPGEPTPDSKNHNEINWIKGNQILSWNPTMIALTNETSYRNWLPNYRLASMENGNNGWTFETLCYGDFFINAKDCGSGKCAFGFEMNTADTFPGQSQVSVPSDSSAGSSNTEVNLTGNEQVVGISLLREFSINLPQKISTTKWLETWHREEVEPGDSWKFYPKMDFSVNRDNITLMKSIDESHYFLQSEWLSVDQHLDLSGILAIEFNQTLVNGSAVSMENSTNSPGPQLQGADILTSEGESRVFAVQLVTKLVDSKFDIIYATNSSIEWSIKENMTLAQFSLDMPITEHIKSARSGKLTGDNEDNLFKIVMEFIMDIKIAANGLVEPFLRQTNATYKFSIANISLSDRCYPNPCKFGSCQQNGTAFEDWNCQCDERHRGRRCEFGRWCSLAHVTPWNPQANSGTQTGNVVTSNLSGKQGVVLRVPNMAQQSSRQPKIIADSSTRISGKDYCQRKLGSGSKCTEIDLPLNDNLYTEDEKTFTCSCQDDYYLSDDAKCKQAHLCNSIVCPPIGMTCDESKPFNSSQPCVCNEKLDWYPDPQDPHGKCIRQQCHDKIRDCGFEAHICLPTLPGERPICKCGPKFALKTDEKGHKYCQSTACSLPTLNDCQQICTPDNKNLEHPYTCSCHAGYQLESDGKSCKPLTQPIPTCRPACQADTQICTDLGCKCKQGFIGEGEIIVKQAPKRRQNADGSINASNNQTQIDYVQSVRCLNICSLTYAENKHEFEMIESVCPLGLCDPKTFQCSCSDSSSSALVNTKYEPIYAKNSSEISTGSEEKQRISPLCHLRRVCDSDSVGYKICRSQGAICVPDYTKPAMFDCICPPSTEKKFFGQGSSGEFTCEPKCSSLKYECLRRQATCRLRDKDTVGCDCLPGHMFDAHDHKCYLAKYTYAINLILVNRYYEPESKFHRREPMNVTSESSSHEGNESKQPEVKLLDTSKPENEISELLPQFLSSPVTYKSIFIADYNQCNISQVIPKSIIEDPYEHDIESFLSYIDQCNEKLHQNVKTYHLNSRLADDIRRSLRQHLGGFTVTTSNNTCQETDSSGMYLNCTVYLQSNEPIPRGTVEYVFDNCDKNGQDKQYCWIKPRLLLKRNLQPQQSSGSNNNQSLIGSSISFRQVIPCELDNFCGLDSFSVRSDSETSLCSCKCPPDIEIVDVKDLEPKKHEANHQHDLSSETTSLLHDYPLANHNSVKEICAPRNHCGHNSTFCFGKPGSQCLYDIRLGSRCQCIYPSYENDLGNCVEVAFSRLDNTLIVIIIMLGTGLIVSIAVNLYALAKSQHLFTHSKQYPLNEFPTRNAASSGRPMNHSTGIPNLGFDND